MRKFQYFIQINRFRLTTTAGGYMGFVQNGGDYSRMQGAGTVIAASAPGEILPVQPVSLLKRQKCKTTAPYQGVADNIQKNKTASQPIFSQSAVATPSEWHLHGLWPLGNNLLFLLFDENQHSDKAEWHADYFRVPPANNQKRLYFPLH